MMNFSVLVVDDEAMPRTVLQKHIPWEELSVTNVYLATDGEEGIEQARRFRPEIIISDIRMPRLNGLEMAAAVREFLPACQLIFLSGYSDKEYLKSAIRLRAVNYVEKPLDPAEITATVREVTAQLQSQAKPTAQELFFHGEHCFDGALNQNLYRAADTLLPQLEKLIRHNKKEETFAALRKLHEQIRRCEATSPEYLRHLYCQILFLFLHAAESRNIRALTGQADHLLYTASKQETLAGLQDILLQTADGYFSAPDPSCPDLFTLVENYIENHYRDCSLTVQSIAGNLGFTNTYLCAAYKKSCGKTINSRLTEVRLLHARELLTTTNCKLYEVANAVGYQDGKYFVKLFTRETGLSPREYQRRHVHEE